MAKNDYERKIAGWFTRGGKRIPIFEKKPNTVCPPQYQYDKIKESRKRLASDKYDDGTYDADTLAPVFYENGYQVSFSQIGDSYTDDEYNALIARFLGFTSDGKASLGKFEGEPELSFHVLSKAEAIKLAKEFNQRSIWDWLNMCEIDTGGTGRV